MTVGDVDGSQNAASVTTACGPSSTRTPCHVFVGPETRKCRCCLPRQAEAAHRKLTLLCVFCFVGGGGATNRQSTGSWCYSLQDCNYFWVYKEGQLLGRCCTKTSFNAGAGTSCTPKMIAGFCGRKSSRCFLQDELRNSYRLKHVLCWKRLLLPPFVSVLSKFVQRRFQRCEAGWRRWGLL
jgi:hypothetical protein